MSFSDLIVGYTFAILSFISTGLYTGFGKLDRVKLSGVSSLIFNLYFQCGSVIFCLFVAVCIWLFGDHELKFTYYGLISGVILGIASWMIWISITYVGMIHISVTSSGISSIFGFIFGLTIKQYPDDIYVSVLSIFLILNGILLVVFNEYVVNSVVSCCRWNSVVIIKDLSTKFGMDREYLYRNDAGNVNDDRQEMTAFMPDNDNMDDNEISMAGVNDSNKIIKYEQNVRILRIKGFIFALLAGFGYGLVSLPEQLSSQETRKLYFLPSFGFGVLIMMILNLVLIIFDMDRIGSKRSNIVDDMDTYQPQQKWQIKQCLLPGFLSGILWTLGFLSTLYSQLVWYYL